MIEIITRSSMHTSVPWFVEVLPQWNSALQTVAKTRKRHFQSHKRNRKSKQWCVLQLHQFRISNSLNFSKRIPWQHLGNYYPVILTCSLWASISWVVRADSSGITTWRIWKVTVTPCWSFNSTTQKNIKVGNYTGLTVVPDTVTSVTKKISSGDHNEILTRVCKI